MKNIKTIVLSALALILLAPAVPMPVARVSAASRGCYLLSTAGYTPVSCPADQEIQNRVDSGSCYFTRASSQGVGTNFEPIDCDSFESTQPGRDQDGSTPSVSQPSALPDDCKPTDGQLTKDNCGIVRYLVIFINVLSAAAGLVILASVIMGGIQYTTAGSDPQRVAAAKDRIRNAVIALLFFIFGFTLLNYLVPGGIL